MGLGISRNSRPRRFSVRQTVSARRRHGIASRNRTRRPQGVRCRRNLDLIFGALTLLVIRFPNQNSFSVPPGTPWGPTRIAYLQYASDAIAFFDYRIFYHELAGLRLPRGPDVSAELRWYPVVTMLQLLFDTMLATGTPIGYGHVYAPKDYIDAWVAVTDPQGWSAADLDRLKQYFRPSRGKWPLNPGRTPTTIGAVELFSEDAGTEDRRWIEVSKHCCRRLVTRRHYRKGARSSPPRCGSQMPAMLSRGQLSDTGELILVGHNRRSSQQFEARRPAIVLAELVAPGSVSGEQASNRAGSWRSQVSTLPSVAVALVPPPACLFRWQPMMKRPRLVALVA